MGFTCISPFNYELADFRKPNPNPNPVGWAGLHFMVQFLLDIFVQAELNYLDNRKGHGMGIFPAQTPGTCINLWGWGNNVLEHEVGMCTGAYTNSHPKSERF